MSKYRFNHSSIYIEGSDDVPKNKLNIVNSEDIHEVENTLLEQAYVELTKLITNEILKLRLSVCSMLIVGCWKGLFLRG